MLDELDPYLNLAIALAFFAVAMRCWRIQQSESVNGCFDLHEVRKR